MSNLVIGTKSTVYRWSKQKTTIDLLSKVKVLYDDNWKRIIKDSSFFIAVRLSSAPTTTAMRPRSLESVQQRLHLSNIILCIVPRRFRCETSSSDRIVDLQEENGHFVNATNVKLMRSMLGNALQQQCCNCSIRDPFEASSTSGQTTSDLTAFLVALTLHGFPKLQWLCVKSTRIVFRFYIASN